jgi:hypothetical protein
MDRTRHEKVFVGRIREVAAERVAAAPSRLVDASKGRTRLRCASN